MADVMVRNLGYMLELEAVSSFGQDFLNDELELRHIPTSSKVKMYFNNAPAAASVCHRLLLDGLTIGLVDGPDVIEVQPAA